MDKLKNLLARLLTDTEKRQGKPCDVCVVGTDERAEQVRQILGELGREDVTVIADDEVSEKSLWVMTLETLSLMPCGGRN